LVNLAYFHEGPVPIAELPTETLARELHVDVVGCLVADAGGVPTPARTRRQHRELQLER